MNKQNNTLLQYDSLIFKILLLHIPVAIFIIPIGFDTNQFALISTLLVSAFFIGGYHFTKGTPLFGYIAVMSLMMFSAIFIQSQLGRIEMHFHIFGALPLMLIYRNYFIPIAGAGLIAVHHLILTAIQLSELSLGSMPIMIYAVECSWTVTFIHAAFVVFETAGICYISYIMKSESEADRSIQQAVENISQHKDLTMRASGNSKTVPIFNEMANDFSELINFLKTSSQNLLHSSQQMSDSSSETNSSLEAQTEHSQQVSNACQEMANSAEQVASHAVDAATAANDIGSDVKKGNQLVQQTVESISQLNQGLTETTESVNTLQQDTIEIGAVLDVIRSVSEQTNLLALNAAIEAARAGEQGRGFAVVADEVRLLAQRTQQSTDEIQDMIEKLQRSATTAVTAMNQGQEQANESSEMIHQAGEALHSIASNIEKMLDINHSVASASEEQSQVAGNITDNVSSMMDAIRKVSELSRTSKSTAHQLSDMSKLLQEKINPYKVQM